MNDMAAAEVLAASNWEAMRQQAETYRLDLERARDEAREALDDAIAHSEMCPGNLSDCAVMVAEVRLGRAERRLSW